MWTMVHTHTHLIIYIKKRIGKCYVLYDIYHISWLQAIYIKKNKLKNTALEVESSLAGCVCVCVGWWLAFTLNSQTFTVTAIKQGRAADSQGLLHLTGCAELNIISPQSMLFTALAGTLQNTEPVLNTTAYTRQVFNQRQRLVPLYASISFTCVKGQT